MKKSLLVFLSIFTASLLYSQESDCFTRLEKAFAKRGAYTVADDMHRNVILSFFEPNGTVCLAGKVRVENGMITSIFIQFEEGDYELFEKKIFNSKKNPPTISNGISEMIYTPDGEKLRIVFIEKLKPKQREYKQIELPDDL